MPRRNFFSSTQITRCGYFQPTLLARRVAAQLSLCLRRAQAGSRGGTDDEDVDCVQQAERAVVHACGDAHGAGAGRWGTSFLVIAAHALHFSTIHIQRQTPCDKPQSLILMRGRSQSRIYADAYLCPEVDTRFRVVDWAVIEQLPHRPDLGGRGLSVNFERDYRCCSLSWSL